MTENHRLITKKGAKVQRSKGAAAQGLNGPTAKNQFIFTFAPLSPCAVAPFDNSTDLIYLRISYIN